MRIPQFAAIYTGESAEDLNIVPSSLDVKPMLLTFPFVGEHSEPIDTPAPFTPRPFSMTVAEAIEWLWRIKQWEISINIPSGPGSANGPLVFSLDMLGGAPASEFDLIDRLREPGFTGLQFTGDGYTSETDNKTLSGSAVLDIFTRVQPLDFDANEWAAYQVGECTDPETANILVNFRLRISLNVYDSDTDEEWIATTDSFDDEEWDEYTDETATIRDKGWETRWPWIGFSNGGSTYLESAPTAYINPSEWWEYTNGTEPIWDSATGAQLRDEVTGELL